MSTHTPGPWTVDDGDSDAVGIFDADGAAVAYCSEDVRRGVGLNTNDRANARLIASSPDHALLLRCICRGRARWEQWEDGQRGEICCGGMRYATHLDDFGCPVVSEHVRDVLTKAEAK